MSAVVCGKRSSSYFEELQYHHNPQTSLSSPPSSAKRIRRSPSRFSSPPRLPSATSFLDSAALLGLLRREFPDMDQELLEKALNVSNNDLDMAIKSLNELRIVSTDTNLASLLEKPDERMGSNIQLTQESVIANGGDYTGVDSLAPMEKTPTEGSEWVNLLVKEMTHASNMDDAKTRASKVLELLEKNISERANAEGTQRFQEENLMLKGQVEALIHNNNILKRAVAIQHERQKESDEKNQEIPHLKQLVLQYQERIRTLEVTNYGLTLHLQQAQQGGSIPGRFHPDVF